MFHITLKIANEGRQEQIEKRLSAAVPSLADILRDYDGDYTKWAVEEMTDEEFNEVAEIDWKE